MTHRFPIKQIAVQAGLSTATVDRVINSRGAVSPQTGARVAAAMAELEAQEQQLAAKGRRVFFDVVVEAPERFARKIRAASVGVLTEIGGAVVRPRFEMHEVMSDSMTLAILDRIAKRGSQGVCLKVRDLPKIRDAVDRLAAKGIPVVTLFTDLPGTARLAYAGLDNAVAGRTAAWLVAFALRGQRGTVLTSQSNTLFAGEEARYRAFVTELARREPLLQINDVSGGAGLNPDTARRFADALKTTPDVVAVYSMGGGNRAILTELDRAGIVPEVYVAHDLDDDNLALLAEGRLSVVLDHNLHDDMRQAFLHLLAAHRIIPRLDLNPASEIRIITPANIPQLRA